MGDAGPRLRAGFVSGVLSLAATLDAAFLEFEDGALSDEVKKAFAKALFGPLFATLALVSFAIVFALAVLGTAILPFAFLIGLLAAILVPAVLLAIVGGEELQFAPLSVPANLELGTPSFYDFARGFAEAGTPQSVGTPQTPDFKETIFEMLKNLFGFLGVVFTALFLAANLDITGLGVLTIGLVFAIFAAAIVLVIDRVLAEPISDVAKFGIGVISLTLAVGSIAIAVVGFIRALRLDPTNGPKLAGVFFIAVGSSFVAAAFSGSLLLG